MLPAYELRPVPRSEACAYCTNEAAVFGTGWEFLDQVYCITLKEREDRHVEAHAQLHQYGLCRKTQMYVTARSEHPDESQRSKHGIFMSHQQVCRIAKERQQSKVLVLEDDFLFRSDVAAETIPTQIEQALQSLPEDWRRLNLGFVDLFGVRYNAHVTRSLSTTAHAVIWSAAGRDFLAGMSFQNEHVDNKLVFLPRSFCIQPILVYQRGSFSTNTDSFIQTFFLNPSGMLAATIWIPIAYVLVWLILTLICFAFWKYRKNRQAGYKTLLTMGLVISLPFAIALIVLYCT